LNLTTADRRRVQLALTAQGFDTRGTDGAFGPRSREMIAAWQRQSGFAATGFLKADQQAALLRTAASAIARFEDEQRREDQRREDQRKGVDKTATTAPSSSASPGRCEGTFRSQWCRGAYQGFPANCWWSSMTITKGNISDSFGANPDPKLRNFVTGSVDAQGAVSILYSGVGSQTHIGQRFVAPMRGAVANGVLTANGRGGENGRDFTVRVECR
jgi:hypothetical protein